MKDDGFSIAAEIAFAAALLVMFFGHGARAALVAIVGVGLLACHWGLRRRAVPGARRTPNPL